MREIRFRAWDTKDKYWIAEGFNIIGECTIFDMLGQFQREQIEKYPGRSLLEAMNDILIEQFTGLQDKNGKDIYEGDIVRTGNMAIGVVYFDIKKQGYLFDCSKGWCHPIYGMGGKKEIIGNIHDNPELLEGK